MAYNGGRNLSGRALDMSGRYYIGVDLGTSAVKLLLVDEQGKVLRSESR